MTVASGYVAVSNQSAIQGFGSTPSRAMTHALENMGRTGTPVTTGALEVHPATAALIGMADARGPACAWSMAAGVVCTPEEAA